MIKSLRAIQSTCFTIFLALFGLLALSSSSPAFADDFTIDFDDQGGQIKFSLNKVQRDQVSFVLNDDRNALLKIELTDVSIPKKYWIRSFKESSDDPDVKGIMVRPKGDLVEIRVRFRRRISLSARSSIKLTDFPNGVMVTFPRDLGKSESSAGGDETQTKTAKPKPSLDPKLKRISSLSSTLADDGEAKSEPGRSRARPSVFDRGTPVAPLPKLEPVREVTSQQSGTPVTSTTQSQTKPGQLGAMATEPKTSTSAVTPTQPVLSPVIPPTPSSDGRLPTIDQATPSLFTNPEPVSAGSQSKQSSSDGWKNQLVEVVGYVLVFLLLLWVASILLRKGKVEWGGQDGGHSIKVLSQKVVNLNPRQRVIVIETMGHTLVIGACDKGGLSHLAHLSTPEGSIARSIGGQPPSFRDDLGDRPASTRSRDVHYADEEGYYGDDRFDLRDDHYHRELDDGPSSPVTYEESTFVGEDAFTVEVPHVENAIDHMSVADSYHSEVRDHDDQFASSRSGTKPVVQEAAGFTLDEEDDDANMKPENLLQLIQKLNGSKG